VTIPPTAAALVPPPLQPPLPRVRRVEPARPRPVLPTAVPADPAPWTPSVPPAPLEAARLAPPAAGTRRAEPALAGRPAAPAIVVLSGDGVVWQGSGRPRPAGMIRATPPARLPRPRAGRRRPAPSTSADPVVRRLLAESHPTVAGRFLIEPWTQPERLPPAPPGLFTVHLGIGAAGFQVSGRPVPPATLARLIRACPEWRSRPLLLLPRPCPAPERLARLVTALIADLRVPIHTANSGVWQLPGLAFTGGTFLRWPAPHAGSPAPTADVGAWLPRPADVTHHRRAPAATAPQPAAPPSTAVPLPLPRDRTFAAGHEPLTLPAVVRRALPDDPVCYPPPPAPANRPDQDLGRETIDAGPAAADTPASGRASAGSRWPGRRARRLGFHSSRSRATADPTADHPTSSGGAASPGHPGGTAAPAAADPAPAADPALGVPPAATDAGRPARLGRDAQAGTGGPTDGAAGPAGHPARLGTGAPGPTGTPDPAAAPSTAAAGVGAMGTAASFERGPGHAGEMAPAGSAGGGRPWWVVRQAASARDRDRLRALLGWRYEGHARAVLSALALHPGLRTAGGEQDVLAGLVCVRAYLAARAAAADGLPSGAGPSCAADAGTPGGTAAESAVDLVLRGDGPGPAEAVLVARCACAGLARLPAVVGLVHADAVADPAVVSRYRVGDVLVEPAFLEASTTVRPSPERTVEYLIWSSTARRTGLLAADLSPSGDPLPDALFAAGTRFAVLAVEPGEPVEPVEPIEPVESLDSVVPDPSAEDAGPAGAMPQGGPVARVLLRELVAGRVDKTADERVLRRLREHPSARAHARAATRPVHRAVGLGHDGRAFHPDSGRPAPDHEPDPDLAPTGQPGRTSPGSPR